MSPFRTLLVVIFAVLILGLLFYGLRLALPMLGLGEPINTIIFIIIVVLVLLAVAQWWGIFDRGDKPQL